jgi:peptidylprolyl isomerase/peptidyl-prolyl cis-trans isomerase C
LGVVVPPASLAARLDEIRKRYGSREEFLADLQENGLDEAELEAAIARELRLEAVLEKVSARAAEVSDMEAEIYYRLHPNAFVRPEMRRLQHILITFDDPAGRDRAEALLRSLIPSVQDAPGFAAAALKHSQCPTALEQGLIGTVKPGQLYPELEPVAFALAAGEVSPPTESPVGLHLLRCDAIHPGATLSFHEARHRIIDHLTEQRRQICQRSWIKSLLKT